MAQKVSVSFRLEPALERQFEARFAPGERSAAVRRALKIYLHLLSLNELLLGQEER